MRRSRSGTRAWSGCTGRTRSRGTWAGRVGFNFAAAFDRPVRIINDAAMQALGNYAGGRMLFLGTGLGSALIADRVIVSLDLAHLPSLGGSPLAHVLGQHGLHRLGKKAWRCARSRRS